MLDIYNAIKQALYNPAIWYVGMIILLIVTPRLSEYVLRCIKKRK